MTPDQITLVQTSWQQVTPMAATAADIFYARLFEIAPQTRTLFPEDMTGQKAKLMQMLGVVVNSLRTLDAIVPAVQALGARHKAYGVALADYDLVGAALLHTLAQGLGDRFTPEVEAAWRDAYATVAGVMIEAQRAA